MAASTTEWCIKGYMLAVFVSLLPLIAARSFTGATHNHFRCFQDRAYLANGYYESLEGYDVIRAHCHRGFRLVGMENRICDHVHQRYTGETPICVDIDECANFEEGSGGWDEEDDTAPVEKCHVNATCENLLGSYRCRCRQGLVGNGFLCVQGQCPPLSVIPNGRMLPLGNRLNKFFCESGYRLIGPSLVQCVNGKWNRSSPKCVPDPTRTATGPNHFMPIRQGA